MSPFEKQLIEIAGSYVPLTAQQLQQLEQHFELLQRWNRKINLTAVRDEAEALERHYAESVFFAHVLGRQSGHFSDSPQLTVADIGSGAGFPGFAIAVVQPNWIVTLVESHQRKAVFLAEAARILPNLRVSARRAEHVTSTFNVLVSRGVRPDEVVPLIPRLAPWGAFLVSTAQAAELRALSIQWLDPVPLPWSLSKLILLGHRK